MRPTKTFLLLVLVTADAGPTLAGGKAAPPRFEIDLTGRVVRRDGEKVLWTARLDVGKDPRLLWDAKRVYVVHQRGVTALAAQTGTVLWKAKGPTDRLLLYGDQLHVTTDTDDGGRWVISRTVTTGAEVSKSRLPTNSIAGVPLGSDRVFLRDREILRVSPKGTARWKVSLGGPDWDRDGGFVTIGDDLVAFRYGRIWDSGVWLTRLDPGTGKVVWHARCAPLGVGHSKYRHDVTVALDGDSLRVTSRGSYGTFVEDLDPGTGKQLKRTVMKD
jgi:outer membrane protein assembly factor BamB